MTKEYVSNEKVKASLSNLRDELAENYAGILKLVTRETPDLFGKKATAKWLFDNVNSCYKSDFVLGEVVSLRNSLYARYNELTSDEATTFFKLNSCLYREYPDSRQSKN